MAVVNVSSSHDRKEFSKEFTKNPEVIVHASSTSKLFEMLNTKSTSDRKIGLGVTTNGGCRSLNDIMTELNSSIASLDSTGQSEDNSSLFEGSSYTTGGSMTGGSMTESMAELAAEDMITALRAQRAHLLERRAELQMRVIHLENDEAAIITGQRVHHAAGGSDWNRKHVNTGFAINTPSEEIRSMDEVSQLEFDVELQKKIVHAARRLAREHGLRAKVKRERKMATQRALLKLQELERKLQCAKRFQRPTQPDNTDNSDKSTAASEKLIEHENYYKAVTGNGYYPHFRKTRTTSSNSDEKGSSGSDLFESDGCGSSLPPTPLVSSTSPSRAASSRHSSSSSIGNNSQDSCVRASLQLTLDQDTKTLPHKRAAADSTIRYADGCRSPPPSDTSSAGFFTPCPVKIDSLGATRGGQCNEPAISSKYEKYRPRAGSFRAEMADNMASRYHDNNVISENIHSYDKYLQTLRLNRQRNNNGNFDSNRNYDGLRRVSSSEYHENSKSACSSGHLNISAVSAHSTVV